MAAASSQGFFTQEEARATEAVAAAARGGVDDHRFGDSTQDVDKEEEEHADLDEEDDTPEPTSTSKGRKKRKKNSPPTKPRIKWTGKE
jgi:basic membrane lipoprotein Med (substrate-binding protein (PBP1-ABC) superfamily)